jgi:hypothetical protein
MSWTTRRCAAQPPSASLSKATRRA